MPDIEPQRCAFGDEFAGRECPRCGRAYCDLHGSAVCQQCASPASAVPGTALVRGSLVAMGIAAVTGLLLLFWSPILPGEHRVASSSAQNPAAVQPLLPAGRPASSAVPTPLPSPAGNATVTGVRSYTVQSGDSLIAIAQNFGTTLSALEAANPGLVATSLIVPGEVLTIPPPGVVPATASPVASATPGRVTATPFSTASPTPVPTFTPSPTASPSPSPAPSPTAPATTAPSDTPSATSTPSPGDTPTPTDTPAPAGN